MKIKTKKLFLFAAAFLFLNVFFMRVADAEAATMDDCYNTYSACFDKAGDDEDAKTVCENQLSSCEYYASDETDYVNPEAVTEEQYCQLNPTACYDQDTTNKYQAGVMNAGNYAACRAYCQQNGNDATCSSQCSAEYDSSVNGGNNSGSGYDCEAGYKPDPKDPTSCIPDCSKVGSGMQYSYVSDDCKGGVGAFCSTPESQDICGDGYICGVNNQCVTSGFFSNGEFGDAAAAPKTAAELAADKAASNAAASKASAATTIQNVAAQKVSAETKQQQLICATESKEACDVATASLNEAKAAYDKATEDAKAAIVAANAAAVAANPSTANSGAGFSLCANGVISLSCIGGGGTPILAGIGAGGGFSSFSGASYGTTSSAANGGCGLNFAKVGGICFPTNTGLADPQGGIRQIITTLFFWLMGLFTIFAMMAFVVSGIQYLMAAGNESLAETAKENATNAVIGIIIGLSGFIIVQAISMALSGQTSLF